MKPSISVQNVYTISPPSESPDSNSPSTEWTVLVAALSDTVQYYKTHGDQKGFERLKKFRALILPVITEDADFSPITLDDAVWARFSDSGEAYQTAKTVLERIQNENESAGRHFNIRLLLHRGAAFVEGKRMFGDAVHLMMDLLPHLPRNEIILTNEAVPEALSPYEMQVLRPSGRAMAQDDLIVYVADTNGKKDSADNRRIVLMIRKFMNFPDPEFNDAWDTVISVKQYDPDNEPVSRRISENETVFFFENTESALDAARRKLSELRKQYHQHEDLSLPVQIVIDAGKAHGFHSGSGSKSRFSFSGADPGYIHITSDALRLTADPREISTSPPFDKDKTQQLYRFSTQKEQPILFQYHEFFTPGDLEPCFYCGGKDHPAMSCPSKMLEYTDARIFEKIGYRSIPRINSMFLDYFTNADSKESHDASSIPEALDCVYQLTCIFQIRFLKAIWESDSDSWANISSGKRNQNGGRLWLALDCIRTSKLDRAVTILDSCLKDLPADYRVHTAFGIVHVEKQDMQTAEYFFSQALNYAQTPPQKIYTLFLCYRLHLLNKDFTSAGKQLSQIRLVDPNCHDGIYYNTKFELIYGDSDSAIQKLIHLIRTNRRFFLQTLFDPDLIPYRKTISRELEELIISTRDEAESIHAEVETQLRRLESLFGKENNLLKEFYSLKESADKNQKLNSYFGYLDVVRFSHIIISRGKRMIEEQKRLVLDTLDRTKALVDKRLSEIKPFPVSNRKQAIENQCVSILKAKERIENGIFFENPKEFGDALQEANDLQDQIFEIDPKIQRLKSIIEFKRFLSVFGKLFFIIQAVNLVVGAMVFPLITQLVVIKFLELRLMSVYAELSPYIGGLVFIGFIFGTLLAIIMAVNRIYSE